MPLFLYRDSQNVYLTSRVIKIGHYKFLMKDHDFIRVNRFCIGIILYKIYYIDILQFQIVIIKI